MALSILTGTVLALLTASGTWAQAADPSLTFEVATVKPATLPGGPDGKHMIRFGAQGGPGTSDPSQISYSFLSLRNLLMQAFGVRANQIQGPEWLDSERFDIVARVPAGAVKDDVPVMLQNLLKERFQLSFHREKKEQAIYAMVVGKGGPKMKLSEDQSDPGAAAPPKSESGAGGPEGGAAPAPPPDPGRLRIGKDGMPEMPRGLRGPGIRMMAMMSPAGMRVRLNAERQTMAQLADSLSNQVDRPVVDMTNLTQRYDFTLDFAPDQSAMMAKMGGLPGGMMPPPPGGAGPGPGDAGPRLAPETDAATVPVAVQEQLGLKLDSRKAPADILVIDHLEKTPSEN